MAPLEKHVRLGNLVKNIVAECESSETFATDPKVVKIYKDKPPKVEDKSDKQDSTLAKPETIALPKDKHTPDDVPQHGTFAANKSGAGVDKTTQYTKLNNYVPANIKRDKESEVPTVSFDWDEKLLHADTEQELEDYFDGAHLVKLKEIMQKEFIAPKGTVSGMMDDRPSKYMFSKDQMPHKGEAVEPDKEGIGNVMKELHPETYQSYLSKSKRAMKTGKRAKYPETDRATELRNKAVDREYPDEKGDIDARYGRPVSKVRDPQSGHWRAMRKND